MSKSLSEYLWGLADPVESKAKRPPSHPVDRPKRPGNKRNEAEFFNKEIEISSQNVNSRVNMIPKIYEGFFIACRVDDQFSSIPGSFSQNLGLTTRRCIELNRDSDREHRVFARDQGSFVYML